VQAAVQGHLSHFAAKCIEEIPRSQREHVYDAIAAVLACEDSEVIRLARQMAGGKA